MYMILRLPQVQKKTGLAKSTIYKKIAEQEFPKPVPLGAKAVGWIEEDINNWIKCCIANAGNDNLELNLGGRSEMKSHTATNDNDCGSIKKPCLEESL